MQGLSRAAVEARTVLTDIATYYVILDQAQKQRR